MRDHDAVRALMRDHAAVMSAIPYYFNFPLAQLAVECGVHFTDLGGNTEIVLQQKGLEADAEAKGVSVVPDMRRSRPAWSTSSRSTASASSTACDAVKLFVGGLPQDPEPPLNYQIVYSLEGVRGLLHDTNRWSCAMGDASR